MQDLLAFSGADLPAAPVRRAAKRVVDFAAALFLLVLLSPLLVVIAIAVRATSPGPAIFRQERIGRDFRPFTVWKFRTMSRSTATLRAGTALDAADPQITRLGHILRATSLDELPQLVNVLRGEMSLVGPRPLIEWEARACLARHALRFAVPPGITGLQQVEVRNSVDLDGRSDRDVEYVRRWSLWLDFAILLRTPARLFSSDGVYEEAASAANPVAAQNKEIA